MYKTENIVDLSRTSNIPILHDKEFVIYLMQQKYDELELIENCIICSNAT